MICQSHIQFDGFATIDDTVSVSATRGVIIINPVAVIHQRANCAGRCPPAGVDCSCLVTRYGRNCSSRASVGCRRGRGWIGGVSQILGFPTGTGRGWVMISNLALILLLGGAFLVICIITWVISEVTGYSPPTNTESGDHIAALMMFSAMHNNPPHHPDH